MSILDNATPGPYTAEKANDDKEIWIIAGFGGEDSPISHIASMEDIFGYTPETLRANKALLAGSWDLAKTALEVVDCWESGDLAGAVRELDNVLRQMEAEA